jgi:tetratricopeptide (TPR) repeat protein
MTQQTDPQPSVRARRRYVPVVGPRLKVLLLCVFGLVSVLAANSLYLGAIRLLEWTTRDAGVSYQNWFYMVMFGLHLALGLLLIVPVVVFGAIHLRHAYNRPNRRAVRVGYLLFTCCLLVLITGVLLMRADVFRFKNLGLTDPRLRSIAYWAHVATPLLAAWLYVLHRLAGPRIQWRAGLRWGGVAAAAVVLMVALHSAHPRRHQVGSREGERYFEPSLARTATGNFIPARTLMMDQYCMACHQDNYDGWFHSAHHFSSFNNEPYLFSVRETRQVSLARDGSVKAARWCAGCHDPVPFFSGAFDDPAFDDVNHPTAHAGITCTTCHAITEVTSTRGNADYVIEEPIHYPFAYATNDVLQYINHQLVKAKPAFHKRTFLKPFMQTAEFCSTCHKVSIPRELNHYKDWLRGQNHYDNFLLSGVSGHGARSFYYPDVAQQNCNGCHMPLQPSQDFGAGYFDPADPRGRYVHDHLFPGANTGIAHLRDEPGIVERQAEFLRGSLRVDIVGIKDGGRIDGPLTAPLRPGVPALQRGQRYLLEVVLRTLTVGHLFTQGTADSNEVWVEIAASSADQVWGRNGGLGPHGEVDAWAHFVNVYMLDREGRRIDRRNPQDIFTPLYNHQMPPGAGQVVHYEFVVPDGDAPTLTFDVKLQYRKFDTVYMNYIRDPAYAAGKPFTVTNDLPIVTIAGDRITFPVEGVPLPDEAAAAIAAQTSAIPAWQRWNDYGIGLLLESRGGSEKGELRQAAHAFAQVEALGQAHGAVNLARVHFREGRLDEAAAALRRAGAFEPSAPRWTVAWLSGLVNKEYGLLDQAITEFRGILEDRSPELDRRGFDFSKDYVVINELGQTYYERAKLERDDPARRDTFLRMAADCFERTLALDAEDLTAHYVLSLVYAQLGEEERAARHRAEHRRYLPDYNAQDRAVAAARRASPAANHAAQATVIYPLHPVDPPGMPAVASATPPERDGGE